MNILRYMFHSFFSMHLPRMCFLTILSYSCPAVTQVSFRTRPSPTFRIASADLLMAPSSRLQSPAVLFRQSHSLKTNQGDEAVS